MKCRLEMKNTRKYEAVHKILCKTRQKQRIECSCRMLSVKFRNNDLRKKYSRVCLIVLRRVCERVQELMWWCSDLPVRLEITNIHQIIPRVLGLCCCVLSLHIIDLHTITLICKHSSVTICLNVIFYHSSTSNWQTKTETKGNMNTINSSNSNVEIKLVMKRGINRQTVMITLLQTFSNLHVPAIIT